MLEVFKVDLIKAIRIANIDLNIKKELDNGTLLSTNHKISYESKKNLRILANISSVTVIPFGGLYKIIAKSDGNIYVYIYNPSEKTLTAKGGRSNVIS